LKVTGVLLSAGESKRMGQSKALLKFGERTNIENLVDEYLSSKLEEVIIVTGFKGDYLKAFIEEKIRDDRLKVTINENFNFGMFSSIQKGVSEILSGGILIGIVDNPFTNSAIINMLIENFSGEEIIIPHYKGKGGHPVIIPFSLRGEILVADPKTTSLKDIFLRHFDIVKRIEFEDQTVTFDMDTFEDYKQLLSLWKK
jgi:molybdenum cofactor cytidylyltransferase